MNSASFLLPVPEGRNKIGKMVLVICPESITQTWLRQWYKAIAIQQPGDRAFGMWWHPGSFAGPTLSQEPTCHAMGYLQIQEFKANLWKLCLWKLSLQVWVASVRPFNAYENLNPFCIIFLKLVGWPKATALLMVHIPVRMFAKMVLLPAADERLDYNQEPPH